MLEEQELKEQRIRKIAQLYYSRKDILDAIFKFSEKREISPRYFEGFGKRPDSFQYPSDILALVKRGATSFHCSEELWQEPLEISTEKTEEELRELRTGWDLIFDIDCNWIDYSKKAAQAIIRALEWRGVKNIGIKFSGNKGFHIIVPWESFPEELDGIKTRDMFPDWPRAIVGYITEISRPILRELIKDMPGDFSKVEGFMGIECQECHNLAEENYQITLRCPNCESPPYIETFRTNEKKFKDKKCPICRAILEEKDSNSFYFCNHCYKDSISTPDNFNKGVIATDIFKILGLDFLLVSSRHLFRMPYSLHEKTALSSIVLTEKELENFTLKDADPLNVNPKNFLPIAEKDEARGLLIEAIDWQKSRELKREKLNYGDSSVPQKKSKKDFKPIKVENLDEKYFPPVINKILKGMKDGRKRALFILLNFFRALGQNIEEVEKKVNEWNKKNNPPIKQGYINSQLIWHSKNKIVLPPNFDNEIYKSIGVYEMDDLSKKSKNPVNYVITKSGAWKINKK